MKKLLLTIIILLAMAGQGWGANWFAGSGDTDFNAVSGGTTSSVWNSNADGTSGTYLDWATQPGNGDVFIANGATIAIDADIGSGSVTVTLTTEGSDYGGTDGGGFTVAVNNVGALTLYTNLTAGTTDCLTINGAGSAGTELTIYGDAIGGTATNIEGLVDLHTGAGAIVALIGDCTAGSAINTYGCKSSSASGILNITGDCYGKSAPGCALLGAGTTMTVTGDCYASDTSYGTSGCFGSVTENPLIIVGDIIGNTYSVGANGCIAWNPAAGGYIKIQGDTAGNYIYASEAPAAANVAVGTSVVDSTDGSYDAGSHAGGGGGAWGF
jgi:hypothetical protein